MAGRSPIGPLMREHRVIERLVAVLRAELDSAVGLGEVDPRTIEAATDFIRNYADRCHHGKEEDILFARLAEKELDARLKDAMDDLVQDHVRGRELTRALVNANERYAGGDRQALSDIESSLRGLTDLYPVHIEKEDRRFFKPCMEYFDDDERVRMLADFEQFDRSLIHEKYRQLVEELETRSR